MEEEKITTVISKITGEKIEIPEEFTTDVERFLSFSSIEEHLAKHHKPTKEQLYKEYIDKLWDLALENFEVKEWKGLHKKLEKVV
jgi:hypothetical protein